MYAHHRHQPHQHYQHYQHYPKCNYSDVQHSKFESSLNSTFNKSKFCKNVLFGVNYFRPLFVARFVAKFIAIYSIYAIVYAILLLYLCMPMQSFAQSNASSSKSVEAYPSTHYYYSRYSQPKYAQSFKYFDYVNPNAPQGGTLTLPTIGGGFFNTFNPFILKGTAAPAIDLMFETLMTSSSDEEDVLYGLIANRIEVAPDQLSIEFGINPDARFNNQTPVTADDVAFSFNTLRTSGTPSFKWMFADVAQVEVLNTHNIRFILKKNNPDMPALLAGLPIFSKMWLKNQSFEHIQFQAPITTGPYLIAQFVAGKYIEYVKNPNYWGKNHPTRVGMYNFKHIRFESYQEDLAKLEAFKAGGLDALVEYRAKSWVKSYQGKQFDTGALIKKTFAHSNPAGMQGFVMNIRRPLFADIRVRQALSLALDFNWLNQQLFFQQYQRINSYFTNSIFAAQATAENTLANQQEYQTLKSINMQALQQQPLPSMSNYKNAQDLRSSLLKAQALLHAAGWRYNAQKGILEHLKYGAFVFNITDSGGGAMARIIQAYIQQLQKLGIKATYLTLDSAIAQQKMQNYDYDMTTVSYGNANLPGVELKQRFGSESANIKGGDNLIGVQSANVDQLLNAILSARDKTTLVGASRAFDRYMLHQYYIIPHWYTNTHRMAYSEKLQYPSRLPKYYGAHDWLLSTWWMR